MFDLDFEVQAWCQSVCSGWWHRDAKIVELADHLYCEIEHLQADGLSEEEAFQRATEKMGNIETLIVEHAKNRNLVSDFSDNQIRNFENWRDSMGPKKASTLIIVVSIVFAAAIIFSSYMLRDTPYEQYSQTVMFLLIALWFVPYTLLSVTATGGKGSIKCEYLYFKRKVTTLFSRG